MIYRLRLQSWKTPRPSRIYTRVHLWVNDLDLKLWSTGSTCSKLCVHLQGQGVSEIRTLWSIPPIEILSLFDMKRYCSFCEETMNLRSGDTNHYILPFWFVVPMKGKTWMQNYLGVRSWWTAWIWKRWAPLWIKEGSCIILYMISNLGSWLGWRGHITKTYGRTVQY